MKMPSPSGCGEGIAGNAPAVQDVAPSVYRGRLFLASVGPRLARQDAGIRQLADHLILHDRDQ
jgi:hypothetical protein